MWSGEKQSFRTLVSWLIQVSGMVIVMDRFFIVLFFGPHYCLYRKQYLIDTIYLLDIVDGAPSSLVSNSIQFNEFENWPMKMIKNIPNALNSDHCLDHSLEHCLERSLEHSLEYSLEYSLEHYHKYFNRIKTTHVYRQLKWLGWLERNQKIIILIRTTYAFSSLHTHTHTQLILRLGVDKRKRWS